MTTLIERARTSRPVTWLTVLGVLLLPAAIGGVFVAALQNPTERLEEMSAAIVNLDDPVEIDGQLAPLGRQLSAGLVEGTGDDDSNLTWVISNEKDAASGLADGTYQAVVTIPEDFSASATSAGRSMSGEAVDPEKATISVTTAPDGRVADGLIANQIATVAASTMGTTLSESTLENVLVGFSTLGDSIGQAADGAAQLASGTAEAASGAARLPAGAQGIASGAGGLASGASDLSAGLGTIGQGARGVQNGAAQLGAGLLSGADQLEAQGIVPQQLLDAAAGSAQAAAGVDGGLGQLSDGLAGLTAVCGAQASPEFCAQLQALADGAAELRDGSSLAAQAAAGTSDGLTQLAAQAPASIAAQLRTAGQGAYDLAGGAGQLAGGIEQSASGASALADGATQLQSGAAQLGTGASSLADGLGSLASGTSDLASGLRQAADSLPSYSDDEATSLASVVASPVQSESDSGMFGPTAIPVLAAVVLWFGALASFIALRAVSARTLASRRPSIGLVLRALAPAAAIGAGQGLLVALIVQTVAGYDPAQWWGFAGVAVLTGVAFAAINQALVAVLSGTGRWVGAVVGVTAIAAAIISTLPGWLASVASALPTSPAATALLGASGTETNGVGSAVAGLIVWAVLAIGATTLAVARRRTTTAKAVLASA
ncbi:YhgE/Pip domain-containing protein [Microbacterium pseudoresistens]|uniref:Putative membrane protein n=1 Tax=Microbacterium pseudoresistens TaxID=640634 RepID=A0A7Y9ET75_9MICO|nr:YhgE/Pip family protein [Microbacterium pseudoresistens]NYD53517.1 putative membrane protein [Microbacterium pseudoresistens]